MKRTILPLLILGFLTACDKGDPPIDIIAYDSENLYGMPYVKVSVVSVVSKVDEIEVREITVNRGNCKRNIGSYTKTLKFGQEYSTTFQAPCRASQVDVETDAGDWTVTYD